jgi:hypothetical protein
MQELPKLLPLAIAWAEAESTAALARGNTLSELGLALARKVGVQHAEKIRVVVADEIPMPSEPLLRQAALEAGLLGPGFSGLTLGYAIFLCRRDQRPQLLAHECRHVAQYESFGSIAHFLATHLRDVVTLGYYDAPLEQDARAFENCAP